MCNPELFSFVPYTADDKLWIALDPVDTILKLVSDPVEWVKCNSQNKATLITPYVLEVQLEPRLPQFLPKNILIQGIDMTNVLTVRSSKSTTKLLLEIFESQRVRTSDAFVTIPSWLESMADLEPWQTKLIQIFFRFLGELILISVCPEEERAYIHFPIWKKEWVDDGSMPYTREEMIALFLTYVASEPKFLYFFIQNSQNREVRFFVEKDGELQNDKTGNHLEPKFSGDEARAISMIYSSDVEASRLKDETSEQEACENLVALYNKNTGEVTFEMAFAKSYVKPKTADKRT